MKDKTRLFHKNASLFSVLFVDIKIKIGDILVKALNVVIHLFDYQSRTINANWDEKMAKCIFQVVDF